MLCIRTRNWFEVVREDGTPGIVFVVPTVDVTRRVRPGDEVRINGQDHVILGIERYLPGLVAPPRFAFLVRG